MVREPAVINFVSSQGDNNSVVSKVAITPGIKIYPAGVITVPLKGTVLAAHVQVEQCYVAHQIAVLSPLKPMTLQEKLFYCTCIRHNAYRFSYGRQADKTLGEMEIPEYIPEWVNLLPITPITTKIRGDAVPDLNIDKWEEFKVSDIFNVKYGINMELNTCDKTTSDDPDGVAFVARTSENNGVSAYVKKINGKEPQPAETITVAGGGSVLSTFVQKRPFYSGRDLYLLIPKSDMNLHVKMFISTVLYSNRYRYSYGRQANKTLPNLILKLPIQRDSNGNPIIDSDKKYSDNGYIPDWRFMVDYIKSLPYSDRI